MRLLTDENFPKLIVEALRSADHDVLWARTALPSWKDNALLDFAESDGRIMLTLDKDFWQIAIQRRVPLDKVRQRPFSRSPRNYRNVGAAYYHFRSIPR
ncbi:MAG: DUF5615 family PIN-like protein [Acidobacteria bacterium]|nr:DUF5615 family PIN-like protein [Acidobacteriota bacterium]